MPRRANDIKPTAGVKKTPKTKKPVKTKRITGGKRIATLNTALKEQSTASQNNNWENYRTIRIRGPFWTADAELFQVDRPETNFSIRTLFLDLNPRPAFNYQNVLLPGTLLIFCVVSRVRMTPGLGTQPSYVWERTTQEQLPTTPSLDDLKTYIKTGELSLLLVHANPEKWPLTDKDSLPEFVCLGGEIILGDILKSQDLARRRLYQALSLEPADWENRKQVRGKPALSGELSVHSSGMTIYGQIKLPWQASAPDDHPITAPFQLARLLPDAVDPSTQEKRPGFRLTIEVERLTETENLYCSSAWQKLSQYLNPKHPQNGIEVPPQLKVPTWVTLEIVNPMGVPQLYWDIATWQEAAQKLSLSVARGEFALVLSDQQPYNENLHPTSLGRILVDVKIDVDSTRKLVIIASASKNANEIHLNQSLLEYSFAEQNEQETIALQNLEVAFSSVETPRFLREHQLLPSPQWMTTTTPYTVNPAVLWAFMPLENGWAQLPIPNLTEQIYLDANVVHFQNQVAEGSRALLQGVVSYGNDKVEVLAANPDQQPWNFNLLDAEKIEGTWILEKSNSSTFEFQLNSVRLTASAPKVILNGFFWLSTGRPTPQDALPSLEDWISGLQAIPLKSGPQFLKLALLFSIPLDFKADLDRGEITRNFWLEFKNHGFELSPNVDVEIVEAGNLWRIFDRKNQAIYTVQGNEDEQLLGVYRVADLLPAVMKFTIPNLEINLSNVSPTSYAELSSWTLAYQVNKEVFAKMISAGVLPADTFSEHLPLVWQHHSTLPMIQALPLTQSQMPPNYPSPSRQLIPYELATSTEGTDKSMALPDNWKFGVMSGNGAAVWPRLLSPAEPAREWKIDQRSNTNTPLYDLPIAALSLPGLVLDPNVSVEKTGLDPDQATKLPMQYRFDLPYTDEINALAQLPKTPRKTEEVSPLPDSPRPEPPKPLVRETFVEHWQRLSERASLASLDAVEAFCKENNTTTIRNLIEPFYWPVQSTLKLAEYPGEINLKNTANNNQGGIITLRGDGALEGVTGNFVPDGDSLIIKLANDTQDGNSYHITAGSMDARGVNGVYRDQRGLSRSASTKGSRLVVTPVTLQRAKDPCTTNPTQDAKSATDPAKTEIAIELTSALSPCALYVSEGQTWHFWFRDLPVRQGIFDRDFSVSSKAQDKDINDPEALSRDYNFLNGYEWRLAKTDQNAETDYLSIFNLRFYPLRLNKVMIDGDNVKEIEVKEIEIIGRLQLPLINSRELEEFSNAVRIIFTHDGENLKLSSLKKEPDTELCEWPLALFDDEPGDMPTLLWNDIGLIEENRTKSIVGIKIDSVSLKFMLFDIEWLVKVDAMTFPFAPSIKGDFASAKALAVPSAEPAVEPAIEPVKVEGSLDLISVAYAHQVSLFLAVNLGKPTRLALKALVEFPLLGQHAGRAIWNSGSLFGDLILDTQVSQEEPVISLAPNALQFMWKQYGKSQVDKQPQLFPGIYLDFNNKQTPGFAALTFEVIPNSTGTPTLNLSTSFLETIILCKWGEFLQSPLSPPQALDHEYTQRTLRQVFGSSAGDMACGYTVEWNSKIGGWLETLLLNGYIEVKNLISWPTGMIHDEASKKLILPAARPGNKLPALSHLRHTIRILFNQHQLPTDIFVLSQSEALFQLSEEKLWQFLAVVEHQLIEVLPEPDFEKSAAENKSWRQLENDRRWTVVQEIRFIPPKVFKEFLAGPRKNELKTIDPLHLIDWMGNVNYGYLRDQLRGELENDLYDAELNKLPKETLLIEASAPVWIRQTPLQNSNGTALQFLPNGNQLGILSTPEDFNPTDPQNPEWLLLTMPFVGRVQREEDDGLDDSSALAKSILQVDPILRINRSRILQPTTALPKRALAFSCWADDKPLEISISVLDWPAARLFARLDPISLEENWFRLQNPLPEPQPQGLQSVLSSLSETPARLSRAVALRRAFDTFRKFYPPRSIEDYRLPAMLAADRIEWKENSLLAWQGVSSNWDKEHLPQYAQPPYSWHIIGLQILASAFAENHQRDAISEPKRYAAATMLPTLVKQKDAENKIPVSLAVSPYVGLEFKPRGSSNSPQLRSVELLCLEQSSGSLRPVASHFWEMPNHLEEVQAWAGETHKRLSPESSIAILRFREISKNTNDASENEATLTTTYSFAIVKDLQIPIKLAKRLFRARAKAEQLHFREGQFCDQGIPQNLNAFEIAPPQIIGFQPLYMDKRPKTSPISVWPWGFSGVRVSSQYTEGKQAVIGNVGETPTLWWQTPQYLVQYRSALSLDRPTAGLPPNFRAVAIKSLLPVLPQPPLPFTNIKNLLNRDSHLPQQESQVPLQYWQPVLPSALRYFILGARAGAMIVLRNQLLRQSYLKVNSNNQQVGEILVSGSIPVQHRMPRPLPLPPNELQKEEFALQTWASYFEPEQNLLGTRAPADEAFFAECGFMIIEQTLMNLKTENVPDEILEKLRDIKDIIFSSQENFLNALQTKLGEEETKRVSAIILKYARVMASRLKMKLMEPQHGAISLTWNGELVFETNFENTIATIDDWEIALELIDSGEIVAYEDPIPDHPNYRFKVENEVLETLQKRLTSKKTGDIIMASARVRHKHTTPGFYQTLSFGLRIVDGPVLSLPLEPRFIHFEDPEYNRRLTSPSARESIIVKETKKGTESTQPPRQEVHTVTLSVDRREYNPDSRLALRFDWDDNRKNDEGAILLLQRIDSNGVVSDLFLSDLETVINPAILHQFPLDKIQNDSGIQFQDGETLQISLIINEKAEPKREKTPIFLKVRIVKAPVIPTPEAAYALLRLQARTHQVECVRFAWSPAPTRIELICPEDLRSDVVRRRAVFQWQDTVRRNTGSSYAIQKIASNGATHFPSTDADFHTP